MAEHWQAPDPLRVVALVGPGDQAIPGPESAHQLGTAGKQRGDPWAVGHGRHRGILTALAWAHSDRLAGELAKEHP
jgi:hypothetical protein